MWRVLSFRCNRRKRFFLVFLFSFKYTCATFLVVAVTKCFTLLQLRYTRATRLCTAWLQHQCCEFVWLKSTKIYLHTFICAHMNTTQSRNTFQSQVFPYRHFPARNLIQILLLLAICWRSIYIHTHIGILCVCAYFLFAISTLSNTH